MSLHFTASRKAPIQYFLFSSLLKLRYCNYYTCLIWQHFWMWSIWYLTGNWTNEATNQSFPQRPGRHGNLATSQSQEGRNPSPVSKGIRSTSHTTGTTEMSSQNTSKQLTFLQLSWTWLWLLWRKSQMIHFQMILDCITWPSSITVIFDAYEDKYLGSDEFCSMDLKRVSSFLKMFIENGRYESCCWCLWSSLLSSSSRVDCAACGFNTASPAELKNLVKFWIGWEVPATEMKVEIVEGTFPTASTCFEKLRLPRHYTEYKKFHLELCACISTCYSGFGCPWNKEMCTWYNVKYTIKKIYCLWTVTNFPSFLKIIFLYLRFMYLPPELHITVRVLEM